MFSIIRESDDATAVNFSAYGKFLPSGGRQLLTIGSKYLRLFRVNPYVLMAPSDEYSDEDWPQKTRLECVFSARFLGPIISMAVARVPMHPETDALLLAFDDGKLSVVYVDAAERRLVTLAMHCFEHESLRDGCTKHFPTPIVRADPGERCAAQLIYGKHLAILPFKDGSSAIPSYTIPLKNIDSRLENVVDMTFLEGYYEPTLLILYEPLQTTAGRAAIRFDTMCIIGVSLNVNDHAHAVVWQLSNLPMDCSRLLTVPKPVGGALLFGSNEIIYLNQAVPPCGIALNSCMDGFTKFPLKDLKKLSLALDAGEAAIVGTHSVVVTSRDGNLHVLTLIADSTNVVKSLDLKAVFETSLASTLTPLSPGLLFVGSRVGDSQLLQYTVQSVNELESVEEAPEKRPKVEETAEEVHMDDEDLELYGDEAKLLPSVNGKHVSGIEHKRDELVNWTVLDNLTNLGPIRSLTTSTAEVDEHAFHTSQKFDPVCDLVAATGHGKDGCLTILQRTIRPQIFTSSPLDDAQAMWAVGRREDDLHRYMIVSKSRSSLVLELGNDEMVEPDQPAFDTSRPTIAAGELGDGALVVQTVTMVADEERIQFIELDSIFPVAFASIVDPFVLLLTQNGRLILYRLVTDPSTIALKEVELPERFRNASKASVSAACVYRDLSGLFKTTEGGRARPTLSSSNTETTASKNMDLGEETDLEDLLLYGDSSTGGGKAKKRADFDMEGFGRKKRRRQAAFGQGALGGLRVESDVPDPSTVEPTYWLVVVRENAKLYLYSLPDVSLVYEVQKLAIVPEVLWDVKLDEKKVLVTAPSVDETEGPAKGGDAIANTATNVRLEDVVVEVLLTGLGPNSAHPTLFMVIDDQLVVYQIFPYPNENDGHLSIRFRRQPLTLSLREYPFMGEGRRAEVQIARDQGEINQRQILTTFDRVSHVVNGVFVTGTMPHLIVQSTEGGLRAHPLTLDGAISSFTPFNAVRVSSGFSYLTTLSRTMRIGKLPREINYETSFPSRKVKLTETIHHVRYIISSEVFVVVSSTTKRTDRLCVLLNDDKAIETHTKPETFVCPDVDEYKVNLYSSVDWKPLMNAEMKMQEFEVVNCCEEVLLRSESTLTGLQNYVIFGTASNYGEEVWIRGRLILCELIEVVPDEAYPTSKHRLKVLYDKEQKGPVSAVCSCNGFLLSALGQKVFIWLFRDNNLQGISFLDMHYYIHSLVGLRNLALACDMYRTISLLRYQEQFKALSQAARDERQACVGRPPLAADFVVDGSSLAFVVSDEAGNVSVLAYEPESKASNGGERLVPRAHYNIGTPISVWTRVKGHTSMFPMMQAEAAKEAQRQTSVWGSLEGAVGWLRPLSEKTFRRLSLLQQLLAHAAPQAAGLNAKGARAAKPSRPLPHGLGYSSLEVDWFTGSSRAVVDGDLVDQFLHLSATEKQDIARRLGTNRYQVMDDLFEVQRFATFY